MQKQGSECRQRWLSPPLLLVGVVLSFVACCLAGRLVSQHALFPRFTRFYLQISPETLLYPTSHQVQALGRRYLERDRVAVIVGGNSVLRGCGQVPEQLWTRQLQEELGDGYRVLNLALNGAFPAEFGGTAAEILARDFPKLIFISYLSMNLIVPTAPLAADVREAAIPNETFYGYFFWEAHTKGLLPEDARRHAAIAARAASRAGDAAFEEQLRGLRVDALSFSRDLWTAVALHSFCTLWVRPELSPAPFTRPRLRLPDLDGRKMPPECLRSPAYAAPLVADLRAQISRSKDLERLAQSGPVLKDNEFMHLPPGLRGRTLMLVVPYSPYYRAQLTLAEQEEYRHGQSALVRELNKVGFPALEAGTDYTAEDFADCKHLAESGGKKLATEVAPAVRLLAQRLGYVPPTSDAKVVTCGVRTTTVEDRHRRTGPP